MGLAAAAPYKGGPRNAPKGYAVSGELIRKKVVNWLPNEAKKDEKHLVIALIM